MYRCRFYYFLKNIKKNTEKNSPLWRGLKNLNGNHYHYFIKNKNVKVFISQYEAIRQFLFALLPCIYSPSQSAPPRIYNNFYDKIFITHAGYAINLYYYSRRTWWVVKIDEQKICSIDCSKLFTLPATILIIQCVCESFFFLVLPPHTVSLVIYIS